ncbi:MAG: MATE family efflux transporter [Lachnospiraceae bacterium]|nr:MATE family efflux transporter [Lachnospiraceae bacterium]MBR2738978.1 MATE family efflux transporter [Lachnospiraceae bacterium]
MDNVKHLYKRALQIAVPIMIQSGITNFVSMLDNIMVGRVGTDPMSAVAIVNQLMFVWYLAIFGGMSGIGIFTAQFCGKKDHEGTRYTFRMMLMLSAILIVIGLIVFRAAGPQLITFYLHEDGGVGNAAATLGFARSYLGVMLIGFLPFAVSQSYSTVLRNSGETVIPMTASLSAVAVNLIGNYILIYGKLGAPALGVTGAAIATVASRFVELAVIVIYTHRSHAKFPFIEGAFRSLRVPKSLLVSCIKKGSPLLLNETLWALAMALLTQCYSFRGLSVVASMNISNTISNVFNATLISMGSAIGILLGQELGMGHFDTVRKDAGRLALFAVLLCAVGAAALFIVGGFFPHVYRTSPEIQNTAAGLIRITALITPINAYSNAAYFTIRSGGKTFITFLFDSVFQLCVCFPVAYVLAHFTAVPILTMYLIVMLLDLIKCTIGFILVRKGVWINDITRYEA